MSLYIVKAKKTKLKANLSASASQITLDELVDSQGNAVVTASFGEWFVLVVKQGDQIEMIKCTAVTQNVNGSATITVATTGRNLTPVFPYVGVATGYSFLSGAEVIVTNDPLTVMSFTNKKNDETVEGLWTFNQTPLGLNAGAVNDASTTAKGIGRASANPSRTLGTVTVTIASPAVFTKTTHGLTVNDMVKFTTTVSLPTGIVAGTTYYVIATGLTANDFQLATSQGGSAINTSGSQSGVHTLYKVTPVFLVDTSTFYGENNNATSTGSSNAYVLTLANYPTSYTQGQPYSFKANFANTGACTLNVNGLGAITIKKQGGSADLSPNDILSGNTVEVIYDGTNFAMISPVANVAGDITFSDGSDGDVVISSNTTLTRNMYYNNLTINNGITLTTAGYIVYVKETLTQVGTGKFANHGSNGGNGGLGGNGANSSGGAGGVAGTAGVGGLGATLPAGLNGVAGGVGGAGVASSQNGNPSPAGSVGTNSFASILNGTPAPVSGVAGGVGGAGYLTTGGTAGAGGVAGTAGVGEKILNVFSLINKFIFIKSGVTGQLDYNPTSGASSGGGGGGANNSNASYSGGGGGGAGGNGGNGGVVCVYAKNIVTANNPLASVIGGNGGTGGNGGNHYTSAGGGGGGGGGNGGNGGVVYFFYKTLTGTLTATLSGGTGGAGGVTGGGGAGGTGSTGNNGANGILVAITI